MNHKRLKNTLEIISCILLIVEIAMCSVAGNHGIRYSIAMVLGVGIFCALTYMTYRYESHSISLSALKCEMMFLCMMYVLSLLTHQYQHMILGFVLITLGIFLIREDQ